MLVLTRKVNEQIRLGDDITVTILRVKGNSIRIGIEAPRDVRVVRGELDGLAAGDEVPKASAATSLHGRISIGSAAGDAGDAKTGMLEFEVDASELGGADGDEDPAEAFRVSGSDGGDDSQARIYQMRGSAPLARFFPAAPRESVGSYTI